MTTLGGQARYAVYWAPPRGSWLEAFGVSWLGWDAEAGEQRMQPQIALHRPVAALTQEPQRYGFHATLKPPFRLAEGVQVADLDATLTAFAAARPVARGPRLVLSTRLGFTALIPDGPAPEIEALAAACVTELDGFRAPLDAGEMDRRRARGLSAEQEARLLRWGYPHVLDGFRFHLTLTGPVSAQEAPDIVEALEPLVAPHLDDPQALEEICLFGDPGAGAPFRLLKRYPLAG